MWLILRLFLFAALFLSFCALLSVLVWLAFGDGWRQIRVQHRARRRKQYRQTAAKWGARIVAFRSYQHVKLVGMDQVSPKERKLKFVIR